MAPLAPSLAARLVALVEREHGLGSRRAQLPGWVEARLERVASRLAADLGCVPEILPERLAGDPARIAELADALRVGETSFFRDAEQWRAIERLASASSSARFTALCVGCSTGEEVWSLALCLERIRAELPRRVVGMDRSAGALAAAEAGIYAAVGLKTVAANELDAHFERQGESFRIGARLRRGVSFVRRDLTAGPPPGRFDLVICKNVLIYFGAAARERALLRLLGALGEEGVLVVARSEVPLARAVQSEVVELGAGVIAFRRPASRA